MFEIQQVVQSNHRPKQAGTFLLAQSKELLISSLQQNLSKMPFQCPWTCFFELFTFKRLVGKDFRCLWDEEFDDGFIGLNEQLSCF
jgi:hypothetical protein